MAAQPVRLALSDNDSLLIDWSDGTQREYSFRELRDACPCATCREKRSSPEPEPGGLRVLSLDETRPLKVLGMDPVGNYAYQINFSDGHDTGIYSLDLLRRIGKLVSLD